MSLRDEPHFKVAATQLADWLLKQGDDRWWSVDGDALLTGRLSFPAPGDELAAELRRIDRTLLVQDRRKEPTGQGQAITANDLDGLATRLGDNIEKGGPAPAWRGTGFSSCPGKEEETTGC